MPPYQSNIPQPTDQLSQSQGDILGNFQAIQVLIDVNHVDFASADQGKHKFVTFPVQGVAPLFAGTEVGLYNFLNASTTVQELYITNSIGVTTPMTASRKASQGWSYLPSGLLIAWGQFNAAAPGFNAFLYATIPNFPGFSATPFNIQLTPTRNIANPNAQVYIDQFVGGANTNLQLGVYVTNLAGVASTSILQFWVIGAP